ncbi:Phenylalanine--tRNA ligase beta subunit [bacterium HR40]|nr:Phenylalanine--tRNA ligase beta subunit [bacterium HR40]
MKFTLPWLRTHLDTDLDAPTLAQALTDLGLEVERLDDPVADLAPFQVVRVREARPHPNAERLKLCEVETRQGVVQVVCGAANARAGMLAIFAPEGARIPGTGAQLKRAVIRGVESRGMLLSARELGIGEDHDGIVEVKVEVPVGTPAAEVLGIEAPVFDLAITPNRADCLGVRGIARDLAAAGKGRLRPLEVREVPARGPRGPAIRLDFPEDYGHACPVFVGRIIRGVENGPSPEWLQRRLKAIGQRPISALVDITNYFTFDLCRPLHVFDARKLAGDLTIRFARQGERLLALDGREYVLDERMVVIADATGPVALGGIMGGESTAVSEATTDVLLEVAIFDPTLVSRAGRRLGIESDARTRFERGLDHGFVLAAAELATRMILELCGGEPGETVIAGRPEPERRALRFHLEQLPRLAGIRLEPVEVERILRALGFEVTGGPDVFDLVVPSWRRDIATEACIVEELARIHGYAQIPPVPVTRTEAVGTGVLTAEQRQRSIARRAAAAQGLFEVVTWSFVPEADARRFGADRPIRLANPLSADLDTLRPSLLPGLLRAASRNLARNLGRGAVFEVGPRFLGPQPGDQRWAIAGVRFGEASDRHWAERPRAVDAIDAKTDLYAILAELGVRTEALGLARNAPAWYHPGRSATIALGPNLLGAFGELHPAVLAAFDIDVPVAAFELDLDLLPKPKARPRKGRPPLEPLPFPPADRDFAFLVDADLPAAELLEAIRAADRKLVRDVKLFDIYTGPGIPEGKKSLAVAVRLQAADRTLSEGEIEEVARHIVDAAARRCGAALRR